MQVTLRQNAAISTNGRFGGSRIHHIADSGLRLLAGVDGRGRPSPNFGATKPVPTVAGIIRLDTPLPRPGSREQSSRPAVWAGYRTICLRSSHAGSTRQSGTTKPRSYGHASPPKNRIDYPADSSWIIARDNNNDVSFQVAAQRILDSGYWAGNLGIWGEQLIEGTAAGQAFAIDTMPKMYAARINIHLHRQSFYGHLPPPEALDEEWSDDDFFLGGPDWAKRAKAIVGTANAGRDLGTRRTELHALRKLLHLDLVDDLTSREAKCFASIHPDDPRADEARICAEALDRGLRAVEALRLVGHSNLGGTVR